LCDGISFSSITDHLKQVSCLIFTMSINGDSIKESKKSKR